MSFLYTGLTSNPLNQPPVLNLLTNYLFDWNVFLPFVSFLVLLHYVCVCVCACMYIRGCVCECACVCLRVCGRESVCGVPMSVCVCLARDHQLS